MREIIFRGKRVDNGEWVEGNLIQNYDCCFIARKNNYSNIGYCYDCDIPFSDDEMFEVKPESIGQFIGLTDKNDKKIFEGDVVEFKHKGKKVTGQVTYKYCRFEIYSKGISYSLKNLYLLPQPDIKAIGNIHDNSELLKAEE